MDTPRTIGKYEILERIGKGGFGVVFKGRDPFIKRLVAVKVCTSEDDTLKRRFLREAEIAGNLHHRNIVTVFEFGYDEAGPFLAQEYLGGEDLEAKIRRCEPVRQDIRMGYLLQIARALEYAHKKGILHRDVKPSNVRVLEDDRVKILDFGIAKLSGAETQLTRSGRILGTAGYLSPEQIKGEPVDARSDIFSFGVLAYELLTYVHPFPGTTVSELLRQVVQREPEPIRSLWPGCPPEVGAVVMRCLEKDPDRRFPSFSEVAEALASVLAGLREAGGPAPEPPTAPMEAPPGLARPAAARSELQPAPQAPPAAAAPTALWGPEPPTEEVAAPRDDDRVATQEISAPGRRPRPPRGPLPERARRLAVAAAVLAAAGLFALAAVWVGLRRWSERAPGAAAEAAPTVEAEPAGPVSQGRLVMDAVPWGEVVRVTDGAGGSIPLPAEAFTPLVLQVAPGRYTVEISSPVSLESRSCQAEVEAEGTARCATEFYRLEALEYFQEAGWWR